MVFKDFYKVTVTNVFFRKTILQKYTKSYHKEVAFFCLPYYDIEIPDYPHHGGLYYPETKYGKTWFRVGHTGERYIHTGRHSLGCITLTEQEKWDGLCHKLMKARKNDGRSIGTLEIID